jgi:hypothetical protein
VVQGDLQRRDCVITSTGPCLQEVVVQNGGHIECFLKPLKPSGNCMYHLL